MRWYAAFPFSFAMATLYYTQVFGVNVTVSNYTEFRTAIITVNQSVDVNNSINFISPIISPSTSLNLPPIQLSSNQNLSITGNGVTFDGTGLIRGLFVSSGNVSVQNMTLTNLIAQGGGGGQGSGGGGGGLGAGGAFFVREGSVLTLNTVVIGNAQAIGGNGGPVVGGLIGGGGGGGMGAFGGSSAQLNGAGGGGLFGNGGNGTFSGAGGGGLFGNGGTGGLASFPSGAGGGGEDILSDGANGNDPIVAEPVPGGNGGGFVGPAPYAPGTGGAIFTTTVSSQDPLFGQDGSSNVNNSNTGGGGGCGGGSTFAGAVAVEAAGGNGGFNGGGGGGGSANGAVALPVPMGGSVILGGPSGGHGGDFGGGGSAGRRGGDSFGGNGGYAGGGAGGSADTYIYQRSGVAGNGGFGGGGGGAIAQGPSRTVVGGQGGFGGGGGGGSWFVGVAPNTSGTAVGGTGGAFAGSGGREWIDPSNTSGGNGGGGGGGAGLGGAIFIETGGILNIQDGTSFDLTNSVTGGQGGLSVPLGMNPPGGNGQALGQDIFMMSGATLILDIAGSLAISSNIESDNGLGSGSIYSQGLIKKGTGVVTLTGTNNYTGTTNVLAGTLVVNGSINSNTIVGPVGTLKGTGTINGLVTVQNGGILSPGNSIGTLPIVGPLTLNPTSLTMIEADMAGLSSLLAVAGTAFVDGILQTTFDPGTYAVGQVFTILTATGGVSGTFNTLQTVTTGTNLSEFLIEPIYSFGSVQLLIAAKTTTPPIPPTPPTPPTPPNPSNPTLNLHCAKGNEKKVGDYLNSLNALAFIQPELTALAELSCEQIASALKSISPGRNAFGTYLSQNIMFYVNRVVTTRMSIQRSLSLMGHRNPAVATVFQESIHNNEELMAANEMPRGSTTQLAAKQDSYAVWASGIGELATQSKQRQNPSFDATVAGGLLGFETYGFSHLLLGASAGYAQGDLTMHGHAGTSDLQAYFLGLYETTYIGNGYLDLSIWGTYNHFKNKRRISYPGFTSTARSTHKGWQVTPFLTGGYDFGYNWGVIEPFASVGAVANFESGFSEKQAFPYNMRQSHHNSILFECETGVNAYESWQMRCGSLILRETLSYLWRRPWGTGTVNASIVGAPGSFTVYSLSEPQNIVSPGMEIFFRHKTGGFVSATYAGEFSLTGGYTSNEIIGKIGFYF